jgi:hypothetical protein
MLCSLGIALDGSALMLGDNMPVLLNTIVPSSVLKKKHNAIADHLVREAIADRIMRVHTSRVKKMSVMCCQNL